MKLCYKKYSLFIAFFILFGSITLGQSKPKVAVVLSGGGAKGFAHIGVLKVFEEAGLKPDIIVGTSMGAIMGGLYSIGYSANELDSLSRSQDWGELLSNKKSLDELNIENKFYHERLQISIPIKKGKITLPKGIIEGQRLQELISKLTFSTDHYESFLDFPIKFNACATNIENGQTTFFENGDLARCLRASMSIPTLFSPVEIKGEYYVDGGIVDNFPVKRAKELGADIIIGVNVGGNFDTGEEVNSMMNTLVQTAFIVSYSKLPEHMELLDLYIEPNLSPFGVASFGHVDSIIERGYVTANAKFEDIKKISEIVNGANASERIKVDRKEYFVIDKVQITSDKNLNRELKKFVKGRFNVNPGDTITEETMSEGLQKIRSSDVLRNLFYHITKDQEGTTLNIHILQKDKATVGATVNYNNYQSFGLTIGFQFDNILHHAAKIRLYGRLSENPRAHFSYLKYMGKKQNLGFYLGADYTLNKLPIYADGQKTNLFNYHFLDVQSGLILTNNRKNALGITAGYRFNDINSSVVSDTIISLVKRIYNHIVFARFNYEYNTLNSRVNPTNGLRINFNYEQNIWNSSIFIPTKNDNPAPDSLFKAYGANFKLTDGYNKLRFQLEYYPSFHRIVSGVLTLDANGVFSRKVGIMDQYYVGGNESVTPYHVKFWGLQYLQSGGLYNYTTAGIGFKIQAFRNFFVYPYANFMVYHDPNQRLYWDTFFSGEKLRTFNVWGVGLELSYQTIVGPIKAALAYSDNNPNLAFFISVGFDF